MMRAALLNGQSVEESAHAVAVQDRGLNYGDGLFETMLLKRSTVRLLDRHLERLATGCDRLGINFPGERTLIHDVEELARRQPDGVIKIVVTRGVGGRGYRPAEDAQPTWIVSLHDLAAARSNTVRVRWCETRLSRNAVLAGLKHLNRLEQVLAQREWNDPHVDEGLMLDHEGELVCGTSTNIFVVRSNELITPDLRFCGVRGIMRDQVLRFAADLGISVREEPLWPDSLESANEIFVTNAVRGIRSVARLDAMEWPRGPVTEALESALDAHA